MGSDRIRYVVFSFGRWRWKPTNAMRAAGFRPINFGHELTANDKARAIELNDKWDRHRRGQSAPQDRYPHGSIGDGYLRAMALRTTERASKGIVWTSEQHGRDDWPRAWKWIEPLLGDCDPKSVTPEAMLELRVLVKDKISEGEAYRVIKVWRAIWKRMSVFGYCEADRDPAMAFVNTAPEPRQQAWREGEAVRLVKCAWRSGYRG